jgi:hypothetical protein
MEMFQVLSLQIWYSQTCIRIDVLLNMKLEYFGAESGGCTGSHYHCAALLIMEIIIQKYFDLFGLKSVSLKCLVSLIYAPCFVGSCISIKFIPFISHSESFELKCKYVSNLQIQVSNPPPVQVQVLGNGT